MDKAGSIKLAVKSLLEVVQTGAKNIEIAVMEVDGVLRVLEAKEIEDIVAEIEREKKEEEEKKTKKTSARASGSGVTPMQT
jgi:acetyl-CoA carboxylase carboxyltransferase component